MPVQHKFIQTDFGNGCHTSNAILDTVPFVPEIMVIGTFNPHTPHDNYADFFYGRNYFWPALVNLFTAPDDLLLSRRMPTRGAPALPLNPTLEEVFALTTRIKVTFSDLISQVLHNGNPEYDIQDNDNVIYNGIEYNLIQDGMQNGISGLQQLNAVNQVEWNTQNIIDYLHLSKSIRTVHFTRQPTGPFLAEWNSIINEDYGRQIEFSPIYTPTGAALPEAPRILQLIRHWLFNDNPNYGTLDPEWLVANGANPDNFHADI
jgi:hypothetical protein